MVKAGISCPCNDTFSAWFSALLAKGLARVPRPGNTQTLLLASLTVLELSPPEMVDVAARAGYSHVGLRLVPATPEEHHFPLVADAGLRRQLGPQIAAAAGAPPGVARALAGDGDKTEVADGGAHAAVVAVHHGHAQAMPRAHPGVRQAHNAGAHHQQIKTSF